ncbi:LrgB family protein [Tissierella creatinophila]|uniref:Inner membrane protein YohK n=1 Tax=Tissierella creatinophila DSM 6911 TaxID=1123403 RepID=A0A1U7M688_TISCR|nr:LrgB family protein [Tissierella creatinophila]OLS02801.1 inner membrane protein YohK [Tissierella creatinophila DSM 6911]
MIEYVDTPLFGVTLTIIVFSIANFVYKKIKNPLVNPIIISTIFIIWLLNYFHISLESYEKGGRLVSFFLGPATVALSIPVYKKLELLKKNFIPTLIGIFTGSLAGILSITIMAKFFSLDNIMMLSLIPKSTTSAIAMDISHQIKGNPSITIAFVIATGTLGNILGPTILNIFKIKSKRAKGVALGTASHIVGTAKAMELGAVEGAMSSLAIGIAGIVTVFLAPLIISFII